MEQNSVSDMNGDVVLADQILSYLSDKHEAGKEARKSGLSGQSQRTTSNNSKGKTERQRRKRAAQACECCRERKIRCDVIKHGIPCTQCRIFDEHCILAPNKRFKKSNQPTPPVRAIPALPKPDPVPNEESQHFPWGPSSWHMHEPTAQQLYKMRYHEGGNSPPIYQSFEERKNAERGARLADARVATSLYMTPLLHTYAPPPPISVSSNSSRQSRDSSPHGSTASVGSFRLSLLPSYFNPVPDNIGEKDLEYLREKGVFSVPDTELRDHLLEAYAVFVHGDIPVLSLPELLGAIHSGSEQSEKLSLLVFNAVMFVASTCIEMKHLEAAGFSTRKEARRAFWERTRLLYNFDYESNQIFLIQALLLMSFWYETPNDSKDAWHWTGLAINLARTIGLNSDSVLQQMDHKKQKLCRRIWWSCFTRDHMVALGTHRPPHIRENEFDVSVLTLENFDFEDLTQHMPTISKNYAIARDLDRQKKLAMVFIEKAKLCLHIGNVLSTQHSATSTPVDRPFPHENGAMALDSSPSINFERCDGELQAWLRDLPTVGLYHPFTPTDMVQEGDTLVIYVSHLHMLYHAAFSTIQRSNNSEDSRSKVRISAASITSILNNLRLLNLVRYVPITSFTFITPALMLHLQEQRNQDVTIRQRAVEDFAKFMKELSEDYGPSGPSTPRRESIPQASTGTLKSLGEKEKVRTLNPGPGVSFYSIIDDITTLIPPSPEMLRQQKLQQQQQRLMPQLIRSSVPREQEVEVMRTPGFYQNEGAMEVSYDLSFSPNYGEFLMEGILAEDSL